MIEQLKDKMTALINENDKLKEKLDSDGLSEDEIEELEEAIYENDEIIASFYVVIDYLTIF